MIQIVYVLILAVLAWLALNTVAQFNILFTTVRSDDAKIVTRNGVAIDMFHRVKGMKKSEGNPFLLVPGVEYYSLLARWFNWFWIGNPLTDRIQRTPILKTRPNPEGRTSADWLIVDGIFYVDAIHRTISRSFTMMEVELAGGVKVNISLTTILQVHDFYIPTNVLKGDFFNKLEELLRVGLGNIVKGMTPRQYIEWKKDGSGSLGELELEDGAFNLDMMRQTGIKAWDVSIKDQELPPDVLVALNKETLATELGMGEVAAARAYATSLEIRSAADAAARKRIAEASGEEFRAMVRALIDDGGVDPDLAAQHVAEVLAARAQPGMTTRVTGGTAQVVVPAGGKKEGNE